MQNSDLLIHEQSRQVNPSSKDITRFWSKVNKDGPTMPHMDSPCWAWTACKEKCGYGNLRIQRKLFKAHRLSWTLYNGSIPHDGSHHGICVLHRCDNPSCVNPSHLFLGSHLDNMRDKESKGRGNKASGDKNGMRQHPERRPRGDGNGSRLHPERVPRGEIHCNAKLTASQVVAIRSLYAAGNVNQCDLATQFHVGQALISRIIRRQTWRHI